MQRYAPSRLYEARYLPIRFHSLWSIDFDQELGFDKVGRLTVRVDASPLIAQAWSFDRSARDDGERDFERCRSVGGYERGAILLDEACASGVLAESTERRAHTPCMRGRI